MKAPLLATGLLLTGCAMTPDATDAVLSADGAYRVSYETSPEPIPLNQTFDITVKVVDARSGQPPEAIELAVDGRMPHHRHGMNRVPIIEDLGAGNYLVRGMLFHMPGEWELHFDVSSGGTTERAQVDIELE